MVLTQRILRLGRAVLYSVNGSYHEQRARTKQEVVSIRSLMGDLGGDVRLVVEANLDYNLEMARLANTIQEIHEANRSIALLSAVIEGRDESVKKASAFEEEVAIKARDYAGNIVRQIKPTDRFREGLNHYQRMAGLISTLRFASVNAFYNTNRVYLQEGTAQVFKEDREVAGMSVPRISFEGGRKVVGLHLRKTSLGGFGSVSLEGKVEDEDLGVWHTHTIGSLTPSSMDLAPFGDMQFGIYPHIIMTKEVARLYVHEFLAGLADVGKEFVKYGTEEKAIEVEAIAKGREGISREAIDSEKKFPMTADHGYISLEVK